MNNLKQFTKQSLSNQKQKKRKAASLILALLSLIILIQSVAADSSYVVRPGDTLAAIARRFGTTIQAIAQANHIINPNLIYVNQTLVIPTGDTPAPAPAPAPSPAPSLPGGSYVVQPGDSLYAIALRFGVSVQALSLLNNLTNINLIYVGQVLAIPGSAVPQPPPNDQPTPVPSVPTPVPTAVPTPVPPPPTAVPPPPAPGSGANYLPNPSFEGGWYHQNGIPELQLPDDWVFEWDEGTNPFDSAPWSDFVRPETRVLSTRFLPDNEHPLYIFDGIQTVKIFKGHGALSFRLMADVTLGPGTYEFKINVFPDLVQSYDNGQKVWATDPSAGELRFIVGNGGTDWFQPAFGQKNTFSHSFTINGTQTIRVGTAMRGRYALVNNGWFMDDWSLKKVGG